MQNGIRHIFFITLCLALISMVYFLLLSVPAPIWVKLPEIVLALVLFCRWFIKRIPEKKQFERYDAISLVFLVLGLVIASRNIYNVATAHGGWDAWAIWNYHARYLADATHWRLMFQSCVDDHPDYPLMLPSLFGFFIALCSGKFYVFIPLIFAVFVTVATISLIYLRLAQRNIVMAVSILLLLATNTYLIAQGVSQYADLPLGLMLLSSLICIEMAAENQRYITLSVAFLGCCMWTKNEGVALAVLFLLFHARTLLRKENLRYTVQGIALPLVVWLLFKYCFAPANDMASRMNGKILHQAFMPERYRLIYQYFKTNLNTNFYFEKMMFFFYAGMCMVRRRLPSPNMYMIICIMLCYASFYVFTFQDLEWHLSTSQDRLMLQVAPVFIYVIASEVSSWMETTGLHSKIASALQRLR